jgi:hypothetical protein
MRVPRVLDSRSAFEYSSDANISISNLPPKPRDGRVGKMIIVNDGTGVWLYVRMPSQWYRVQMEAVL